MPLDPAISLGVKVPDSMSTLSSMMDLGNKQLQLQKGRATFDADVAQRQAESSSAQSAANVANQTQDAVIQQQQANTGIAQQQEQQAKLQTLGAHVTNGAKQMMSLYGTGATPEHVANIVKDTMTNAGAQPDAIQQALSQIPTDSSQIDRFIINKSQSALALADQINSKFPAPTWVNNGQQQTPVSGGNPSLTGVPAGTTNGTPIQNQISPSEVQTVGKDIQGNPYIVNKNPANSKVDNITGAPVDGQPTTSPLIIPKGETQATLTEMQNRRSLANQAASTVPDQHFNNNEISRLLDESKAKGGLNLTGPNAGIIAKISTYIGSPVPQDQGSAINSIQHYLALQTQKNEATMGVHSDAGQHLSSAAAGSVEQDPTSLKNSVKVNDAGVTGVGLFNKGMEKAIENSGNDPFSIRKFQNQWSSNYDPNAMRLFNATTSHDKSEVAAVFKSIGAINKDGSLNTTSPAYIQLRHSISHLENLANTGGL